MAIKIFSHSRNNVFTAKGVYLNFGLEYTFARWKKYSSKLDISRSLVRIFETNSNIFCTRCEKH